LDDVSSLCRALVLAVLASALAAATAARAQPLAGPGPGSGPSMSPGYGPPPATPAEVPPPAAASEDAIVVGIRAVGASPGRVEPHIKTRLDRPFNQDTLNEDVKRLNSSGHFLDVKTSLQRARGGVVVIFEVVERPTIKYIKFVGAESFARKKLLTESGLKVGAPLNPYAIADARGRIEEYYKRQGFYRAQVEIYEGNERGDKGAVFVVNEGDQQKIWTTRFVGNTIATDARLRTQIKSKAPFTWPFYFGAGNYLNQETLEGDIDRLTAYYRSLGFFRARVGREIDINRDSDHVTITYVIDEGPRYVVRDVSVVGFNRVGEEQLMEDLVLKPGEFFDQAKMTRDVNRLRSVYGGHGYIHADIKADPRFLEEPGRLDLVYNIAEGARYRVSTVNVIVNGDHPHTRISTVLNRLSIRPGDIADNREIDASKRRLLSSGLFARGEPGGPKGPQIKFGDPEDVPSVAGQRPAPGPTVRGQSPDDNPYASLRPYTRRYSGDGVQSPPAGHPPRYDERAPGAPVRVQPPEANYDRWSDRAPYDAGQIPDGRSR